MIAISGKCFSGSRSLARQFARDHEQRCLEAEVVIERAAALGAPHAILWDALQQRPRLRDRLLRKGRMPLVLLQAALAEEILAGAAVCWGGIADLLPHQYHPWIRVHLHAPMDTRVSMACERLKLSRREAIDVIGRQDRERDRWMRYVHGAGHGDYSAYDVVVNLDHMSIQEACEMLSQVARKRRTDKTDFSDFALSCEANAALILSGSTSHLELGAAARNGVLYLSGKVPSVTDLEAVRCVALQVPSVNNVNVDGIGIPSNEGLPAPAVTSGRDRARAPTIGPETLWPAWVVISVLVCLAAVYSLWRNELPSAAPARVSGPAGERTVYAGYITDTECGHRVKLGMTPSCIRSCVDGGSGASYALYDGRSLYVLGDQAAGERYAAERVHVVGEWDRDRAVLEVKSIHPVL